MKPIPKSLHTVTVLVAIARDQLSVTSKRFSHIYASPFENLIYADCVDVALSILGLDNTPDTYGLRDQAIRKLNRGAA